MDYAQYVSRRPPSPPLSHTKLRSFSVTPSMSSVLPTVPFSTDVASDDNTTNPSTNPTSTYPHDNNPNENNNTSLSSSSPSQYTNLQSPTIETSTTTAVSTYLHRRAVRDEYTALAAVVKAATDADVQRDRQEVVRIRLEHMLSIADARSFRILTLALQKCNAKLDSLASATRSADEARARMRVIESKHFHGARAAVVPPELRALHIRRGALATLVDHILCTLHDQVRIHFLLTQLASNLSSLRSLLVSLDKDRSSQPVERFDRNDDSHVTAAPPSTPTNSLRSPTFSNLHAPHRVESVDGRMSSNTRASFCADTSRHPNYQRRVSHSYALRHFSQDGVLSSDRPSSPSPLYPTSIPYSSQPRSVRNDAFHPRRHIPQRDDPPKLIQQAVKRALSYNANQQNVSEGPADETSWWGDTPPPSATAVATAPPSSKPQESKQHSRISFVAVQSRLRGDSKIKTSRAKNSGSLGRAVDALPWRRRAVRVNEDPESGEDDALPVSPISHSTVSDCHSSRQSSRPGSGSSPGADSEQSVLLDIDSLCTEACSVITSSRVEGGKVRRRGSLSSGLWVNANDQPPVKHLGWLGFGRLRAHGQMKRLWVEINELYSIVVTHGPHLVEEKIVPRSSLETGLLGSWNAGKGQGSSLRVTFQTGIVVEAMRKVEGIVGWQRRLVVAIRRDLYEQRRSLRQLDRVISQAYLASLEDEKG